MKTKLTRFFCLALIALLLLGTVACKKDEEPDVGAQTSDTAAPESDTNAEPDTPNEPDDPTTPPTQEGEGDGDDDGDDETQTPTPNPVIPTLKTLHANYDGIKLIGPRVRTSNSQLYLDFMGQGFELALDCKGDKVSFMVGGSGSFLIWVDGVATKDASGNLLHAPSGNVKAIQLTGLTVGNHVIRVIKADSSATQATVSGVLFAGNVLTTGTTADKALYVEFVGDGSLMNGADVTATFAYQTASALDADYMLSAWADASIATGSHTVKAEYGYVDPFASSDKVSYDFDRKANAVVLSVGGNDTCEAATFEQELASTFRTILQNNGSATKIYLVYESTHAYKSEILSACESFGGSNVGVYTLELTGADQSAYAAQLTELIRNTVNSTPAGLSGTGTIVPWENGVMTDPQ